MKQLSGFSRFSKFIAVFMVVALIAGLGFQFASPLRDVLAWIEADLTTVVDVDGPDDYPGQKDLNFLQYYYPAPYEILYLNWGFDNTDWSGNNTGDGCALFDTNNNGFADYAYCSTINGLPAKLIYKQLWTCGDSRADRCTTPNSVKEDSETTDALYDYFADPFSGVPSHQTGNTCSKTTDPNCYNLDTRIMATILLADMPGTYTPRLLNVCSYPSEIPNSDPSDCIFDYIGNVDVQVEKTDFDYDVVNGDSNRQVGEIINYEITVTYPTGIAGTGAIARNVVMTDALDQNVKYVADSLWIDPTGIIPVCTTPTGAAGGNLVCTAATMTPVQSFTVKFQAEILSSVPTAGIIEIGTCIAATHIGTRPNLEEGAVDICNPVTVTTTNDLNTSNNSDSDPADVIVPTAVDLLYFEGTGARNSVILEWATASELDTIGFNLYRRGRLDGTMRPINNLLVQAQVPGAVEGASYIFKVDGLKAGKFYYFWLEDVDMYGNTTLHGPIYVKAKRNDPIN